MWNNETPVALKKLKNSEQLKEFAAEAAILFTLIHPNVVQFFGLYTNSTGEQFIVVEYMSRGSLLDVLRTDQNTITESDQISMCNGVAAGMVYLEKEKIVHRDLAARNLLCNKIEDKWIVKISDFGMSRHIEKIYSASESTVPVRWCSPEVLQKREFSTKSDVWAFAVTMWEIFEHGNVPFGWLGNQEVFEKVIAGEKLPRPNSCSPFTYGIMLDCWKDDPNDRPSFKEILSVLPKAASDDPKIHEFDGTGQYINAADV